MSSMDAQFYTLTSSWRPDAVLGEQNFFLLVSSPLILSFSILDAVSMKTQAYFNRTAYLPCPFTKAQNISLSELVVFWQDHKKSVLYEHYLGKEKLDNVNAKYLGRTSFDGDNWTLGLHSVQIKDMGTYDCFIQKKTPKGSVILQQTETDLSVIGTWSMLCSDRWPAHLQLQMSRETLRLGIWQDWTRRRQPFLGSPFEDNVGSEGGELKALCVSMVCFLGISENFL